MLGRSCVGARIKMQKEYQNAKEKVLCAGIPLENVWRFKYLGSIFRADGSHLADVRSKIAVARTTAGKMRSIWSSRHVPLSLKIRIYKTGVCSKLAYGSESWLLDETTIKMLNGVNSQMVAKGSPANRHTLRPTQRQDTLTWLNGCARDVYNGPAIFSDYTRRQTQQDSSAWSTLLCNTCSTTDTRDQVLQNVQRPTKQGRLFVLKN